MEPLALQNVGHLDGHDFALLGTDDQHISGGHSGIVADFDGLEHGEEVRHDVERMRALGSVWCCALGAVACKKRVVMWFSFFFGFRSGACACACVRVCVCACVDVHVFFWFLCVDGSDVLSDLLADGPIGIAGTNEGEVRRPALLASTAIQEGGAHGAEESTLLDDSPAGILDEGLDFGGHAEERVAKSPVRVVVAGHILDVLFHSLVPARQDVVRENVYKHPALLVGGPGPGVVREGRASEPSVIRR